MTNNTSFCCLDFGIDVDLINEFYAIKDKLWRRADTVFWLPRGLLMNAKRRLNISLKDMERVSLNLLWLLSKDALGACHSRPLKYLEFLHTGLIKKA